MYHPYFDIREKLGEPQWHDEHGVPRYVAFHPDHVGVYYDVVALLEIQCQSCGLPMLVADASRRTDFEMRHGVFRKLEVTMPSEKFVGSFGYGDAPWHGDDQCAGTTMTTDVYRIVEFWTRDGGDHQMEWRRRPEYEFAYPHGA